MIIKEINLVETMEKTRNESNSHYLQDDNRSDKTISVDPNKFLGIINHNEIFKRLCDNINEPDLHSLLNISSEKSLRQKHIIYGVVKHLFDTAANQGFYIQFYQEKIYIYNGCFWRPCAREEIKAFLIFAAIKMGIPEYDAGHYDFAEKLFRQFLVTANARYHEPTRKCTLINLQNGTFEFAEDQYQLREFDPADFLTFQLPFDYIPEAPCPQFESFLNKVLPDNNCQAILQEFLGSIFTSLNLEKCLMLLGNGANGKSVFFAIINALLGQNNVLNFSLSSFNQEYNRARLRDVILNYSSEKGFDLSPDIFKTLVSGEPIHAREPYGSAFTIRNKVKFITNCNELPQHIESTDAYFRRLLIIPFEIKIPDHEKDGALANKIIQNELPGVFNWLLEGLKRITSQGDFTKSERVAHVIKEFRSQSDSVELFLHENGFIKSFSERVPLNDLFESYKKFCREDNYKPEGKNRFSNLLERKGYEKTRTNVGHTAFLIEKKLPDENEC